MGLFGKKEANHNGLLNKIANPNPNGPGLIGRLGGLVGGLFNRGNKNTTQTNSFQKNDNNKSGASW